VPRTPHTRRTLALALLALLILASAGCSLIGLGLGSVANHNMKREFLPPRPASDLRKISSGTIVVLELSDSTRLRGRFQRIGPPQDYPQRYAAWRDSLEDPQQAPEPGARVEIGTTAGGRLRGRFRGFWNGMLVMEDEDKGLPITTPIEEIRSVATFRGLKRDEARPLPSELVSRRPPELGVVLRADGEERTIPASSVVAVSKAKPQHFALTLGLIGLAADLWFLWAVSQYLNGLS
jgi:hypothetical protein